jgi:FkbM family methyltransferase
MINFMCKLFLSKYKSIKRIISRSSYRIGQLIYSLTARCTGQHIRYCHERRLFSQAIDKHEVYSPSPYFFQTNDTYDWLCNELYFKRYAPQKNDVVVDIGAGLGAEAVWLLQRVALGKYVALDAEPHLYPALVETSSQFPGVLLPCPYAIGTGSLLPFASYNPMSYLDAAESGNSMRSIPTISWQDLQRISKFDRVDLLKVNIEGGEGPLFESLAQEGMDSIKRVIVACHDFRTRAGESEFFTTKERVKNALQRSGFQVSDFALGFPWADDWLFAERL